MVRHDVTQDQEDILQIVKDAAPANPLAFVRDAVRTLSLQTINTCIQKCTDCPCHTNTRSMVCGDPYSPVLIIRENVSPDQIDQSIVLPYSKESKRDSDVLLTETFEYLHINPDKCLWMNAVQCCPQTQIGSQWTDRAPNKTETENCKTFVDFAIQAFAPSFIILLGNVALNMFFHTPIADVHGKQLSILGIPTIPIYSPEYILFAKSVMNPSLFEMYKDAFFTDFETAASSLYQLFPDNDLFIKKEKSV